MQIDKCDFGVEKVEYLGHILTSEGVKSDPKKITNVKDYPEPKTVSDVRGFLGLVGYHCRFIPNFTALAKQPNWFYCTEQIDQTIQVTPNILDTKELKNP